MLHSNKYYNSNCVFSWNLWIPVKWIIPNRYQRNNLKICCSWKDDFTTAQLSEIWLQEMETRNDQSRFHYLYLMQHCTCHVTSLVSQFLPELSTSFLRNNSEIKFVASTDRSLGKEFWDPNCWLCWLEDTCLENLNKTGLNQFQGLHNLVWFWLKLMIYFKGTVKNC